MRKLTILLLLIPAIAFSQTPISGIVNRYAAVTNISYCTATLTVSDPSNFSAGNRVLLIQMKGAVINASNTSAFGVINQMASAGKCEWGTVQSVTGNDVRLQFALVNNYDPAGSIQLVYVPQYDEAIVTGLLTAPAWNGSTGGVVAIDVQFSLYFQANVDVSGKGFRGGEANILSSNNCSWLTPQTNYFYPLNNWRAAAKGEGITAFLNNAEAGRGPQANGGGGGNDHNAGGGGGGHFSAGGRGGANEEPSTFGCSGNSPGLGGRAIPFDNQRLFMGGGGGAGHENNDLGTNGGHGGGIVILKASFITGNGFFVRANGLAAANSLSDGAGGGGAGGTIIIPGSFVVNNLTLEAKGGRGGDADNANGARCMGPGGGGSGGRLSSTGLVPPQMIVTPGQNGISINSTACTSGPNGAQSGQPGQTSSLQFIFPEGNTPITPLAFTQQPLSMSVCPGDSVVLRTAVSGSELSFQWQLNTGTGWQNISDNATYSGSQSDSLIIRNVGNNFSGHMYSLQVNSPCYAGLASQAATLTVLPAPISGFTFSLNGSTAQFTNTSQGAGAYQWSFGDGNSSQSNSPAHTYSSGGIYTVQLIAINACGTDTSIATVSIIAAPMASFSASPNSGCTPLSVEFNSNSIHANNFQWSFPGGQPVSSTLPSPQVLYTVPGIYDVRLIVNNSIGADTLLLTGYIHVEGPPSALFNAQTSGGLSFNFSNASQGATSYQWNFGDGNSSTTANPAHTYASAGFYTVTLTAINSCGSNTFTITVTAGQAPSAIFGQSVAEACAPMAVQFYDQSTGVYASRQWSFPGGNPAVSNQANPTVIYAAPGTYGVTLSLSGPLGTASSSRPAAVTAYPFPEPSFNYAIQGNTVTFTNTSTNASSYSWLFGDGNNSQAASPVHTYAAPGVYTVTLNAQRPYCAASTSATVFVTTTSTGEADNKNGVWVFPNPVMSILFVRWKSENNSRSHYRLWNVAGIPVAAGDFVGRVEIDVLSLPAGFYTLEVEQGGSKYLNRVLKVQ